ALTRSTPVASASLNRATVASSPSTASVCSRAPPFSLLTVPRAGRTFPPSPGDSGDPAASRGTAPFGARNPHTGGVHNRRPVNRLDRVPDHVHLPHTLGALRASGHRYRTVKDEVRENLLHRMRSGEERFPGIVGFAETVLPQLERALLARHDVVLLGERGQGKTRLIRTLTGLLDEWSPAVAGCALNDHPYAPVSPQARRMAAEYGDDLPVVWRHRDERYGEKLATPDTGVADLIGDVDPVRLAEGRS